MNDLRDPQVKLSGSDTGTCCRLAAPSEAPSHGLTSGHWSAAILWVCVCVCPSHIDWLANNKQDFLIKDLSFTHTHTYVLVIRRDWQEVITFIHILEVLSLYFLTIYYYFTPSRHCILEAYIVRSLHYVYLIPLVVSYFSDNWRKSWLLDLIKGLAGCWLTHAVHTNICIIYFYLYLSTVNVRYFKTFTRVFCVLFFYNAGEMHAKAAASDKTGLLFLTRVTNLSVYDQMRVSAEFYFVQKPPTITI